jgi:hypothetical protein
LKEFLPKNNQGCIVFTTRDKKTAVKLVGQNFTEVPEMDEGGAMQLLQKSLAAPILLANQRDAKALVRELTYLPLAIVQAAAYINENSIAPADYLSLLNEQENDVIDLLSEEFEDDGRYRSVKNPVATTWLISFEQIRHRDPLAADYLSFMACIDRNDIPQLLLPAGPSRKKEIEAVGTLMAYSFIIKRGETMVFDLHRLVHLATRSWLQKESSLSQWGQAAIERLDDLFPDVEHQNRAQWRIFLPHAAYALRRNNVAQDNSRRLDLAWKYAKSLGSDGRYREAEKPFEEVFQARNKALGEEHPSTLTSMAYLAWTYSNQGQWKEAEGLRVRVLKISKRVLGEEHPNTLSSMVNLATTLWRQGLWKDAEELEVRVMETRKRLLGAEHPHTLISMSNLASTYVDQGRWKEAEELGVRVLEISKRVLGEEHPSTLAIMGHLGSTYRNQGRLKEAEELGVRVMETRKRLLGEEHPSTLVSMNNLALTRKGQGRDEDAIKLMDECVRLTTHVLGASHPFTLSSSKILDSWKF